MNAFDSTVHALFGDRGVATLAALAVGSAIVYPDPQQTVVFLGAVGLGLGIGAGAGVAAYKTRVSKSRTDSYLEIDRVLKTSTLEKLDEAVRAGHAAEEERTQLRKEVSALRTEIEREKQVTLEFARGLLERHGHIEGPNP